MSRRVTIALAGNPNSGKTTLFNALTGSRHHVGNWPGKTVERREGRLAHGGVDCDVVDLPGIYSLAALSPEQTIARDYLLGGEADVVVIVVDATGLERNLYLAVQILEMGVPAVIALNLSDIADARGLAIDRAELAARLGVPVVRTVARREEGVEGLVAAALAVATEPVA